MDITPPHNEKDLSWLIPYLPLNEIDRQHATLKENSLDDSGGLSGAMLRKVTLSWNDGNLRPQQQYIYKFIQHSGQESSKQLGLPREAFFYKQFADILINQLDVTLAYPYYSFGNMATGEKVLLLEDLSNKGVLTSYYFGPASPVNWNKDLSALTEKFPGEKPTVLILIRDVFQQVARMHRTYWKDESILNYDWLRSSDWLYGKNQESWEASQTMAKDSWKVVKEKIAEGKTFSWNSQLVQVVDAALAKIDWNRYQDIIHNSRSWTLVHGDFHPGNIFWVSKSDGSELNKGEGKSVLLDWEMVGLGNGPQELAQYMISHVDPATRRAIEEDVLLLYYQNLTSNQDFGGNGKFVNPEEYSYSQCRQEYIYGGFERWVWFLAALPAFCPEPMIEYWHNQSLAFLQDHGISPESVGMPRV